MEHDMSPDQREPKGDHNRRLSLGLDLDQFAREAGVTPRQLKDYEMSLPDDDLDPDVASRVGAALARLEANPPPEQKVRNA
jgi:transcriptional regulator with XRE-family HTH domain